MYLIFRLCYTAVCIKCSQVGTRRHTAFGERRAALQVPARFEYEVATSVEEAIDLLERHGPEARLLAGGHSLIPMMKLRLAFPETLIDIHELDGDLRYIREENGTLEIGALARHQDVLDSEIVRESYPILWDAETTISESNTSWCLARAPISSVPFSSR